MSAIRNPRLMRKSAVVPRQRIPAGTGKSLGHKFPVGPAHSPAGSVFLVAPVIADMIRVQTDREPSRAAASPACLPACLGFS